MLRSKRACNRRRSITRKQPAGHATSGPIYDMPSRIIAIGDLHGDYQLLISLLVDVTQVMTSKQEWIAGNTYLVVCGDMLDRLRSIQELDEKGRSCGEGFFDEIKILDLLNNLHKKAVKKGGKVIKLIGNHEIMNLQGDFTYVTPFAMMTFQAKGSRKTYFQPGGEGALKILAGETYPMVKIGKYFFVHGGISADLIEYWERQCLPTTLLKEASTQATKLFNGQPAHAGHVTNILLSDHGLCWDRSNSTNKVTYRKFQDTMEILGEPKGELIVAHCPQIMHYLDYDAAYILRNLKSYDKHRAVFTEPLSRVTQSQIKYIGINSTQRGRCWHIDVAASRCFPCQSTDSDYLFAIRPSALQITKDGQKNVLIASKGLPRYGPPDGGIPIGFPFARSRRR